MGGGWGSVQWSSVPSGVQPDVLQSLETPSVQSGEEGEQVLGAVAADVLVHRRGDADDQRPAAEARRPIGPPQPQVVTVDLRTRARCSSEGLQNTSFINVGGDGGSLFSP